MSTIITWLNTSKVYIKYGDYSCVFLSVCLSVHSLYVYIDPNEKKSAIIICNTVIYTIIQISTITAFWICHTIFFIFGRGLRTFFENTFCQLFMDKSQTFLKQQSLCLQNVKNGFKHHFWKQNGKLSKYQLLSVHCLPR